MPVGHEAEGDGSLCACYALEALEQAPRASCQVAWALGSPLGSRFRDVTVRGMILLHIALLSFCLLSA